MLMILFTSILINLTIDLFNASSYHRKIYQQYRTNNPNLATSPRGQKEDYWIRALGTATSYGCNDKIDGIGILSSPICRSVNVNVNKAMVIVIIHPLYFMMFH